MFDSVWVFDGNPPYVDFSTLPSAEAPCDFCESREEIERKVRQLENCVLVLGDGTGIWLNYATPLLEVATRIICQKSFLKGETLRWKTWKGLDNERMYNQCEFCRTTFSEPSREYQYLCEGYATADDMHWVCDRCAIELRGTFEWSLVR